MVRCRDEGSSRSRARAEQRAIKTRVYSSVEQGCVAKRCAAVGGVPWWGGRYM